MGTTSGRAKRPAPKQFDIANNRDGEPKKVTPPYHRRGSVRRICDLSAYRLIA